MSSFRVGNGYDVHLLAPGLPLVLGGVKIEHTKGCVAHSDGDAAIHSLCDALLGALALGDIGKYYPDSSDEFKGIDSKILLERTYKLILEKGWRLVNADITILLQKPKIAPYISAMQNAMSEVFEKAEKECRIAEENCHHAAGNEIGRIAVKATTTEKAGFVGREEGVAAYATVLLERA